MSELYNKSHEHAGETGHEEAETFHDRHETHEALRHSPESGAIEVDQLHEAVEKQHPTESAELLNKLEVTEEAKPIHPPNKELRMISRHNYLTQIRSSLGPAGKAFSKFIHEPKVNAISEITGRTIVRPTAILFGGIFMFVGSAIYLYTSDSTDSRYNFFLGIFLFIGGFAAGLIVELIYRLFFRRGV